MAGRMESSNEDNEDQQTTVKTYQDQTWGKIKLYKSACKTYFLRVFFISEHKVITTKGKAGFNVQRLIEGKWKSLKFHRHLWILSKINPEDLKKDNLY